MTLGGLSGGGERLRADTRFSHVELCTFTKLHLTNVRAAQPNHRVHKALSLARSCVFPAHLSEPSDPLPPSAATLGSLTTSTTSRRARASPRPFYLEYRHHKLLPVAMGSPGSKKREAPEVLFVI